MLLLLSVFLSVLHGSSGATIVFEEWLDSGCTGTQHGHYELTDGVGCQTMVDLAYGGLFNQDVSDVFIDVANGEFSFKQYESDDGSCTNCSLRQRAPFTASGECTEDVGSLSGKVTWTGTIDPAVTCTPSCDAACGAPTCVALGDSFTSCTIFNGVFGDPTLAVVTDSSIASSFAAAGLPDTAECRSGYMDYNCATLVDMCNAEKTAYVNVCLSVCKSYVLSCGFASSDMVATLTCEVYGIVSDENCIGAGSSTGASTASGSTASGSTATTTGATATGATATGATGTSTGNSTTAAGSGASALSATSAFLCGLAIVVAALL